MTGENAALEGRRVAVLGGGLAGLTAAYQLSSAGAAVTLFERDPWLGGRARTDVLDGFRIDIGTQLVGSMYGRFRELVREIGLGSSMLRSPGRDASWRGGRAHEVVYGSVASMIASGGLPLTTKMRLGAVYVPFLSRNAHALDLLHPELAADAGLDAESIADWGHREIDRTFVKSLVYPQLGAYYGSLPEDTSAAFYHILARYGMDVELYAVRGGVGSVAERLGERITESGGQLRLEAEVEEVGGAADRYSVAAGGSREEFDAVVSSLPAEALARVLTDAPESLRNWLAAVRYRPTLTLALLLDRPVDAGYFGLSFPRGETEFVAAVCVEQNKPGVDIPQGKGLLVAIATPEATPRLMEMDSSAVGDRMVPEIRRAFPNVADAIERARVYRWPIGRPTFYPGYLAHLQRFGKGAVEGGANFAICGDYLVSPSVEGATVSGMRAARRIAQRLVAG